MKPSDQIRHAILKSLDAHLSTFDREIAENPDAISGMRPPLVTVKIGIRRHNKVWKVDWTSKLTTQEEMEGSVELDDPEQSKLFP